MKSNRHMESSRTMAIGELAATFGLGTHVLRYWEDMGLLTPARLGNGRRVYGPSETTRVALILLSKDAGLTLEQTRQLFADATDREARRSLYRRHRDQLARRIAAAQDSLAIIEHAAECDADDITTCPRLHAKIAVRASLPAIARR
jgi:DNA-binding transcriptional MerR regulator